MTERSEQAALTIRTMTARAQDEFGGFRQAQDHELVGHLMTTAYDLGYDPSDLKQLAHAGIQGYGFFRNKYHVASVVRAQSLYAWFDWDRFAILISATGKYEGLWAFMLDNDGSLLIAFNRKAYADEDEIQGLDLLTAIITSALSGPLTPPARHGWRFGRR